MTVNIFNETKYDFQIINNTIENIFSGEWGEECTDNDCVSVLRTTNFTNDGIINYNYTIKRNVKEDKVNSKILKENDIIIEKSGGGDNIPVGRVVFCDNKIGKERFICNNFTYVLRINNLINEPKYIFYYLFFMHKMGITEYFQNKTTGIRNLQLNDYLQTSIPLPSLDEQKRVVKIVEAKLTAVEKVKTANDIQLSIIKKLFDSYVDNIYRNGNWNKVKLGDITIINPSTRGKIPDDNEMCVSFVPMTAVDAITGTISNIENKKLSEVRKGYTYFENEDILFAKITPCMENGKSAIARNLQNKIGFGSTEFHVIKATESILPEWVHFYLRQRKYLKDAKNFMTGSVGQQRLPDDYLYDTLIPLPPLEEQKKIVSMLIQKQSLLNNLCNNVAEQSTYIKALPSSILRKAFNGDY